MRPSVLSRLTLGAVVGAQLAYPQLSSGRQRRATLGIVGLGTAAAATSLVSRRGGRGVVLALLAAGVGSASEAVGTRTGWPFGRYRYRDGLGPTVSGLPVGVPAAWVMMAPAAWSVAGCIARSRPARVALAAGSLTAWDVALDPRMVREGFWEWAGPGRYEGIPASNFAGWLATSSVLFATWSLIDAGGRPADEDIALYSWTWVGEVVANVVFWRRPRVAVAGGLAMGAFAVPALRARLAR